LSPWKKSMGHGLFDHVSTVSLRLSMAPACEMMPQYLKLAGSFLV
jgi:hypothetical protein